MNFEKLISKVNNWNDFKNVLDSKTKLEKGNAFEELTKFYLQYNPVYKSKLKNVWLQKEVIPSILKKLNLPSNDQGIDLIAETFEGDFWAIQCKYLQEEEHTLSHRTISTFISLSKGIAKNISYCLVATTLDDYAKIYKGNANIGFCNSDEWRKLDKTFFDWVRSSLKGKEKKLIPFKPMPHQSKAIKKANEYFLTEKNKRGKLVFPCGAGKSLTGYWIANELNAKNIIVAVPSLSLVKQTLEVYLRESVANNETISWLCVCSDEGIGKNDDVVIHTNEIGVPCVTDKNFIANWLIKNKKNKTIVFTTYQSGKTIADACAIAKCNFDLGIMDEAHKTVGDKSKLFSHLLFDENIKIDKRIFMTATERRYAGSSDNILSMDDVEVYGETFAQMSFKEAIEVGILSDYKIITLLISNQEVKNLIEKNAYVKPIGKEASKETEARTLASLIALRKAMTIYPIHHAVTFHSSIKNAVAFEQSQDVFGKSYPKFSQVKSYHVSGSMPTSVRGKVVDEFAKSDKGVITNAKCLTEGIDVPNIDCVLFADPRKSTIDIVQAVGRALRKKEGKDFGYVILPVFTNSNNKDEIIESDEFKEILSTIRALASNDERIIEYFREISKGNKKPKNSDLLNFEIDELITEQINENELIENIQLKTWNKLAKLSWMPFEEAREFVRKLNFKSNSEWRIFCSSGSRPIDLPYNPEKIYKNEWINWGDYLGTGIVSNQKIIFRSFSDAKKFTKNLKIKSQSQWIEFCKSGKKPSDIPTNPNSVYKNEWISFGDFFWTGTVANYYKVYRSFEECMKFVRNLKINSQKEWKIFCKSGKKPSDIPTNLNRTYQSQWKSWGDFFGTDTIASQFKVYRSFEECKNFVRNLKINSQTEWYSYCKTGKKPDDIPRTINSIYKKEWTTWGDFFGNGNVANQRKEFSSFKVARAFVHKQKLKSNMDWRIFCKSGKKPVELPTNPEKIYKEKWKGWADFLGKE